eukprot:TRINITY_DN65989_c4_g1_i1.p1 TRINITY_DN65989_c4_g1~~TRINITY_DN65989_c4_g1_i1.p1  ORF type:complete len:242 (+),score=51.72 TRINITY_DN65989_c4_g1_i1:504-1229(+)
MPALQQPTILTHHNTHKNPPTTQTPEKLCSSAPPQRSPPQPPPVTDSIQQKQKQSKAPGARRRKNTNCRTCHHDDDDVLQTTKFDTSQCPLLTFVGAWLNFDINSLLAVKRKINTHEQQQQQPAITFDTDDTDDEVVVGDGNISMQLKRTLVARCVELAMLRLERKEQPIPYLYVTEPTDNHHQGWVWQFPHHHHQRRRRVDTNRLQEGRWEWHVRGGYRKAHLATPQTNLSQPWDNMVMD